MKIKLLFLIFLILSGCQEQIAHNLTELEANRIVARFQNSDVDIKKISQPDGKWAISVAKNIASQAIAFLESEKLLTEPENHTLTLNPLSSADERGFALERSTSRTIEETLLAIEGVERAKVHLFLPRKDPLEISKSEQSESASVLLITAAGFSLNVGDISALVGGAAGISADRISVVINKSEKLNNTKFVAKNLGFNFQGLQLFLSIGFLSLGFLSYRFFIKEKKRVAFIEER